MARLNVEMDVFSDVRFLELIVQVGDHEKALGMLVAFWMHAQKHWCNDRQLVPTKIFEQRKWQPLLEVGLAEARPSGIYAKGSEEKFDWLLRCKEAGSRGGKKSAELRASTPQGSARVSNLLTPTLTLTHKKKINKKRIETKPLCKEWPANHIFAKSFANLNRIDAFAKVFDVVSDESRISRYLEEYKLSASEMEEITFLFAEWADGPLGEKIKSPRGTLSTFVRGYVKRRSENPTPLIKEPKWANLEDIK